MKSLPLSRLTLVYRTWSRRSAFTSVERFPDYLPQARKLTSVHIRKRPARFFKALSNRANRDGYNSVSAGLEFAALWHLLRFRPRVVHYLYADHDYYHLGPFTRRMGIKLVGSFWFSLEEFERRMPNKSHLRDFDLVLATGQRQMDYLAQFVVRAKLAYLPLGIDSQFFRPADDPNARWQAPLQLLQVGTNRRDFETLKAVFERLRQAFPTLELHMIGAPEAKALFQGVPRAIFHGFLDDQPFLERYQRAALLVLPLLEGGSSNALNEALATGLPIVATQMPNLEDYVNTACVISCERGNVEQMVNACAELLTHRARWNEASTAARTLGETYEWTRISDQLIRLYAQHLGIQFSR